MEEKAPTGLPSIQSFLPQWLSQGEKKQKKEKPTPR
jgi:hypothetical protein